MEGSLSDFGDSDAILIADNNNEKTVFFFEAKVSNGNSYKLQQQFEKFKSKERIIFDNWDSDNDLYLEANKKSPVVLIVGPPRIGKTSIANKLSTDLQMEFLEPSKYFESIFKKVEEFEEKMQNWEEENPNKEENENGEEGENVEDEEKKEENEKAKKKKR